MDKMIFKILICFAVFSSIGWMILFLGISTRRDKRKRDMFERTCTTGRIVGYVERKSDAGKYIAAHSWCPMVEFTVFGQKYTLEYDGALDMKKWPAGSDVTVGYDGNDPAHFHLEEDFTYTNGGSNAIRIGIIWILCAAVATLTLAVLVGDMSLKEMWFRIRMLFRSH